MLKISLLVLIFRLIHGQNLPIDPLAIRTYLKGTNNTQTHFLKAHITTRYHKDS